MFCRLFGGFAPPHFASQLRSASGQPSTSIDALVPELNVQRCMRNVPSYQLVSGHVCSSLENSHQPDDDNNAVINGAATAPFGEALLSI